MTTTDLAEKIARAIRLADTGDSLPEGFAARMWDEGVTNRDKEMRLAAAVLPIVRTAIRDALTDLADDFDLWETVMPTAEVAQRIRHERDTIYRKEKEA